MEFQVTGTHIWYYYICKREVWLMIHQMEPDEDDENILIGRIIGEHAYKREKKEVDLGNAKLDLIRTEDGQVVVGEVKKSSRFVESASKQLLFYLLQLKQMGIDARGELLIPEEKKKIDVLLDEKNEVEILAAIGEVEQIAAAARPPEPSKNKYCRKCAYSEFCWA
jgi:CRISPR-associated exonuclease Cas4